MRDRSVPRGESSKDSGEDQAELEKEGIEKLTRKDLTEIQASADGVIGRPHIADYLVRKGIVRTKQEAFDKYLVKCNVPKYPLYPEEASRLIRDAGWITVLALYVLVLHYKCCKSYKSSGEFFRLRIHRRAFGWNGSSHIFRDFKQIFQLPIMSLSASRCIYILTASAYSGLFSPTCRVEA